MKLNLRFIGWVTFWAVAWGVLVPVLRDRGMEPPILLSLVVGAVAAAICPWGGLFTHD